MCPTDERVAVVHAAFHVIAGDNDLIQIEEIEELFAEWGLPDAKEVAQQVFGEADENADGVIDFEEFTKELWFIWERVCVVGEAEHDKDGDLWCTFVQDVDNKKEQDVDNKKEQ
jgi:hypothetical protein